MRCTTTEWDYRRINCSHRRKQTEAESSTVHGERLELTANRASALREIARPLPISQASSGSYNVNDAVRDVM